MCWKTQIDEHLHSTKHKQWAREAIEVLYSAYTSRNHFYWVPQKNKTKKTREVWSVLENWRSKTSSLLWYKTVRRWGERATKVLIYLKLHCMRNGWRPERFRLKNFVSRGVTITGFNHNWLQVFVRRVWGLIVCVSLTGSWSVQILSQIWFWKPSQECFRMRLAFKSVDRVR